MVFRFIAFSEANPIAARTFIAILIVFAIAIGRTFANHCFALTALTVRTCHTFGDRKRFIFRAVLLNLLVEIAATFLHAFEAGAVGSGFPRSFKLFIVLTRQIFIIRTCFDFAAAQIRTSVAGALSPRLSGFHRNLIAAVIRVMISLVDFRTFFSHARFRFIQLVIRIAGNRIANAGGRASRASSVGDGDLARIANAGARPVQGISAFTAQTFVRVASIAFGTVFFARYAAAARRLVPRFPFAARRFGQRASAFAGSVRNGARRTITACRIPGGAVLTYAGGLIRVGISPRPAGSGQSFRIALATAVAVAFLKSAAVANFRRFARNAFAAGTPLSRAAIAVVGAEPALAGVRSGLFAGLGRRTIRTAARLDHARIGFTKRDAFV